MIKHRKRQPESRKSKLAASRSLLLAVDSDFLTFPTPPLCFLCVRERRWGFVGSIASNFVRDFGG